MADRASRLVSDLIRAEASSRKTAAAAASRPGKTGPRDSLELETLRDYKKWSDKFFRRVAGKPPQGIPAPVPVTVFAKDAADRMFSLSYWVFLDLPLDRFEKQYTITPGRLPALTERPEAIPPFACQCAVVRRTEAW